MKNNVVVFITLVLRLKRSRTILWWWISLSLSLSLSLCIICVVVVQHEEIFQNCQKRETFKKRWDRVRALKFLNRVEIGLQSIVMERLSMEISIRYVNNISTQCKSKDPRRKRKSRIAGNRKF